MRYFIGLLVAIGLIILIIILMISNGKHPVTPGAGRTITQYASTDTQVIMTIDGPINADSLHDQVRVTVDNADVTYQHIQGYEGNAVDTQIFANNQNAYSAFLAALQHAGFTQGDDNPALRDESGYCPLGDRYIFVVQQDDKTIQRYWETSCGQRPGTYLGDLNLTVTLFQNQVPGYNDLTQNIQF